MSLALAQRQTFKTAISRALPWVGMGICLTALAVHFAYDRLRPNAAQVPVTGGQGAAALKEGAGGPGSSNPSPATSVTLTESKLKTIQLTTEAARYDRLATELGVPGRIEVNSDRRIEIRPRAAGVVREVHVVLGQTVKRGDCLATLDSPDIGTARLNLRSRQRELTTARIEADWKSRIAENVAVLIPLIRKGTDPGVIEKQFADKQLGTYRGTLLQAYADFDIAAHEEGKTSSLRSQQVIGEHPAVIARHAREGLQAKLEAAIEQVRFDAAQEKRLADQRVRRSESDVIDAAQRLRILGVSENIQDLLDQADRADAVSLDEDVTVYKINAPFDGTIITKTVVPSQKVDLNDLLCTLADLNTVWVNANISESDLAKLPRVKGGTIRISITSYPGRSFSANLLSVGALVDSQTRTVPLLAQADNRDGLLKPGMFARILLDSPASEQALTIPRSAVVEIEGKTAVFVPSDPGPEAGHHTFTLRAVETGREAGDRVVVKTGLISGDQVVATGAFLLKSELILQNQAEED